MPRLSAPPVEVCKNHGKFNISMMKPVGKVLASRANWKRIAEISSIELGPKNLGMELTGANIGTRTLARDIAFHH